MTTSLTKETNNSKKLSEKRTSILTCSRRSAHLKVSLPSVLYNSISLCHPVYWLLIGNDREQGQFRWIDWRVIDVFSISFFLCLNLRFLVFSLYLSLSLSLSLSLLLSLSIYLSIFHSLSISIYLSSFLRKLELANGGLLLDNKNESIKIRTDSH